MTRIAALAQPSLPGIITSITGIATVVGIVVTIVVGFYQIRRLRDEGKQAERQTSAKLEVIHALVNSTLTASIESDLEATRLALATMRDLSAERAASGHEVPAETVAAMRGAEVKIDRLTQQMADRLHSAERLLSGAGPAT